MSNQKTLVLLIKDSRVILVIFSWTKIIYSCSTESSVKFHHSSTILYYMPDKILKRLNSRIIRNFFTLSVRTGLSAFEAAFWKFVWFLMLCKAVNGYIGDSWLRNWVGLTHSHSFRAFHLCFWSRDDQVLRKRDHSIFSWSFLRYFFLFVRERAHKLTDKIYLMVSWPPKVDISAVVTLAVNHQASDLRHDPNEIPESSSSSCDIAVDE